MVNFVILTQFIYNHDNLHSFQKKMLWDIFIFIIPHCYYIQYKLYCVLFVDYDNEWDNI